MKYSLLARSLAFGGICLMASSSQAQSTVLGATSAGGSAPVSTVLVTSSTTLRAATSKASGQLVDRYAVLTGSSQNAKSLILGLRYGEPVVMTGINGQAVTLVPPGRPMGWGNVNHALSLAQADLARQGISQPTPDQLRTALLGGSLTTANGEVVQTPGVLTLRGQGMGWGQIARTLGVSPAMSSGHATSHGILAANGALAGEHREFGRESPRGEDHGRFKSGEHRDAARVSTGISTAAGTSPVVVGQHRPMLSAAGSHAGASGAVTADSGITTGAGTVTAGGVGGMGKISFAGAGGGFHGGGESHGHFR